uniref:ARM repeat superfamily protein n=1 Tax=Zea mays TaxID=4577 RepID=A0A804LDJ9_MAIZE
MDRRVSLATRSVRVLIPDQLPTLFEPQKAVMTPHVRASVVDDAAPPERRLTMLALQLAVLEKAASRLGTLGFIWATVVLLGGFAITLGQIDFWCITTLLLVEGARILGRSHELEWQHETTGRAPVSWAVGRVFHWLQLLSASSCAALSLVRLVHQRYGGSEEAHVNRHSALDIFYGLALAEALLFLVEKALWQWRVGHHRLLERVAADCHLNTACGAVAVRRFFYDSYSRCLNGSIFEGLHMDLVSYADDLLTAGSHDEQRLGASILAALVESDRFADATLRKIGTSGPTIERLIEMLSWKNASEKDVRRSAAVVVFMLTGRKLNALRVTGIPGAMESVASLLYADLDELNLLGLSILNKLARDHDNCDKIGRTRGLLDRIISYAGIVANGPATGPPTDMRLKAVKQSLRVVKRLASTTGTTGKLLRRELSDIVFTVSNIREVLQLQQQHDEKDVSELHRLAIEILTNLAMDEEAREMIGGTGGVVSTLVSMFLPEEQEAEPAPDRHKDAVRVEAGEALAMLALDSRRNCGAIIMAFGGGVDRLVETLSDPVVVISAARILRNLCTYAGEEYHLTLRGVTAGATKTKLLNISIGLAAQMLRFMQPGKLRASLATAGVTDAALARTLVLVLREYSHPSLVLPRIRLHTLELAIALMRSDARFVALFVELGMEAEQRRVAETTSGLECFNVFSGSVGLSRRVVSVGSLVESAMELMRQQACTSQSQKR